MTSLSPLRRHGCVYCDDDALLVSACRGTLHSGAKWRTLSDARGCWTRTRDPFDGRARTAESLSVLRGSPRLVCVRVGASDSYVTVCPVSCAGDAGICRQLHLDRGLLGVERAERSLRVSIRRLRGRRRAVARDVQAARLLVVRCAANTLPRCSCQVFAPRWLLQVERKVGLRQLGVHPGAAASLAQRSSRVRALRSCATAASSPQLHLCVCVCVCVCVCTLPPQIGQHRHRVRRLLRVQAAQGPRRRRGRPLRRADVSMRGGAVRPCLPSRLPG
jgi:hypothetical protein